MTIRISKAPPGVLVSLLLVEFIALSLLFVARLLEWWKFDSAHLPLVYGEVFPIVAPWAGAFGGVTMGLFGLAKHWGKLTDDNADEDSDLKFSEHQRRAMLRDRREWNAWYLLRLPIGMALGSVGALLVVFISGTVAVSDAGGLDVTPRGVVLVGLIAFAIGYRQESFEELLTRLFDVVAKPGGNTGGRIVEFKPEVASMTFASTAGQESKQTLTVSNQGTRLLQLPSSALSLSGADATQFRIGALPSNLAEGEDGTIEIVYAPTAQGSHEATLTITVGAVSHEVALTGTA